MQVLELGSSAFPRPGGHGAQGPCQDQHGEKPRPGACQDCALDSELPIQFYEVYTDGHDSNMLLLGIHFQSWDCSTQEGR